MVKKKSPEIQSFGPNSRQSVSVNKKPRVYLVFLGGADIYSSYLSCKNNINLATGIAAGHIISYDEDLKTVQIWRNSPIYTPGNTHFASKILAL